MTSVLAALKGSRSWVWSHRLRIFFLWRRSGSDSPVASPGAGAQSLLRDSCRGSIKHCQFTEDHR